MATLKDNYKYQHIASATTTQVDTGQGQLIMILVGTTAAGTITVVDAATGSATPVVSILQASVLPGTFWFLSQYVTGLQIITGAASDITVVYAPIGA